MNKQELKSFLDEKYLQYNTIDFIDSDPIQIPHRYSLKEDIEISAFLVSTIAWGNRKMIINNSNKMMGLLGDSPYDFIRSFNDNDLDKLDGFVHRTFNSDDLKHFVKSLKNIYENHNGLESIFSKNQTKDSMQSSISAFKQVFF